MTTSITSHNLFHRQIALLGEEGQSKILASKILVIGAGGLGCPALQYLASAGVGEIGILDFDLVSLSNLQRQILFQTSDIGKSKALKASEALAKLAPFTKFKPIHERLSVDNAQDIIGSYDIILDCTDNFYSKFLIHDISFKLKKILIQASVYQFEGQIQVFNFQCQTGPCLRCLWPEEPIDGCIGTCAEVGVMGPLLGVIGSLQAAEALKIITNMFHLKNNEVLFIDLATYGMEVRKFKHLSDCPLCVKKEFKLNESLQIPLPADLKSFILLDVRSSVEFKNCPFIERISKLYPVLNIPLEQIENFTTEANSSYLTICSKGIRSLQACHILRKQHNQAFSLLGGVEGYLQTLGVLDERSDQL